MTSSIFGGCTNHSTRLPERECRIPPFVCCILPFSATQSSARDHGVGRRSFAVVSKHMPSPKFRRGKARITLKVTGKEKSVAISKPSRDFFDARRAVQQLRLGRVYPLASKPVDRRQAGRLFKPAKKMAFAQSGKPCKLARPPRPLDIGCHLLQGATHLRAIILNVPAAPQPLRLRFSAM
jgi:hypothetical protein